MEDLKKSLKMPFFGSTFSPKKTPPRKSASLSSLHTVSEGLSASVTYQRHCCNGSKCNFNRNNLLDRSTREIELGVEYGPPSMSIGGQNWKFEDGQWISETGGNTSGRELQRLKKRNVQLEEENNLLKLKIEVLLDMLTETTVENHLMEKEVEDMKSQHRRKK